MMKFHRIKHKKNYTVSDFYIHEKVAYIPSHLIKESNPIKRDNIGIVSSINQQVVYVNYYSVVTGKLQTTSEGTSPVHIIKLNSKEHSEYIKMLNKAIEKKSLK